MNTRREFLIGTAGLLLMTSGTLWADGKRDAPADTVRAYLAARARQDTAGQYALFSPGTQDGLPLTQFKDMSTESKTLLAHAAEDGLSPLLACVSMFFMDPMGQTGYQFTILGPDPTDPSVVLVQAQPPGVPAAKAFLLKIATTAVAGAARLDLMPSYQKTSAHDAAVMQEQAKGLSSISNLRQIGLALITYPETHMGRLPDADNWGEAILPQWKNARQDNGTLFDPMPLFHDPSAPEGQRWNYAFNRALSGVKLADIADPAATVMVFESTAGTKNAADTGQSLPRPGRHHGGDYYVFANGHAQWFPDGTKLSYRLNGK